MRLGTLYTRIGARMVARRDDRLVDLASADLSLSSLKLLLRGGDRAMARARRALKRSSAKTHPLQWKRLDPPVANPSKVLCIGRNYRDHAEETGGAVSARPEVFMRSTTSLAAPFASVRLPQVSRQMDYEVELAVVIGTRARYVKAADAMKHVAGFTVFNDISIRDYQHHGSQWTPGKNFDGTGVMGPFLVTADKVPDYDNLELTTTVVKADGSSEELQHSNTSLLVHKVPDLIAYLSEWTTLEPGDVIATGTPAGVGMARDPQRWLQPGEKVICSIQKLGAVKNLVVEESATKP